MTSSPAVTQDDLNDGSLTAGSHGDKGIVLDLLQAGVYRVHLVLVQLQGNDCFAETLLLQTFD